MCVCVCAHVKVAESTLNLWKLEHPTFSESLRRGKGLADADVAHSLYNRAMGYEHDADDIKVVEGSIVITPTIKRYPPDATSAIFWLKNRQPELWRDKPTEDDSDKQTVIQKVQIEVICANKDNGDSTAG